MQAERWGEIVDKVKSSFEVIDHTHGTDELDEIETLTFQSPLGRIKLELVTRPVVLDKKIVGGYRRAAGKAHYEYTYSDTEKSHRLTAYKEVDGEWEEIDPGAFA